VPGVVHGDALDLGEVALSPQTRASAGGDGA
jgi:hypothetical protein